MRQGRSVDIRLTPPIPVTCMAGFPTAALEGRVYIGMGNGDLRVVEGGTGQELAFVRCGHRNSIGWLVLEVCAIAVATAEATAAAATAAAIAAIPASRICDRKNWSQICDGFRRFRFILTCY